jgi:hypothetical protein
MATVTLDWVSKLTLKEQSALFSSLRGPDTAFCGEVKKLSKFIRQATQINADPTTGYMEDNWREINPKNLERELEFCTLHYIAHLCEGLAYIEAYTDSERDWLFAVETLNWFSTTFHLNPRRFNRHKEPDDRTT